MVPLAVEDNETCVEIATGAIAPRGADCIVPYEEIRRDGEIVSVSDDFAGAAGTNIHRRGSDHAAGAPLLHPGMRLTGREVAVAASCGAASLRVSVMPRVAIVATGDELAEVEASVISPHQVRRSNDHALRAALLQAGFTRVERLHLRDVREEIVSALQRIIAEYDALILTGGVSKGKFDYLPDALTQLGVRKKFQGVAQRPGKPFWFGISSRTTPVFALPGNPVSTYTCFCRYALPALEQICGLKPAQPEWAVLEKAVTFRPKLAYLLPVAMRTGTDGVRRATPMATNTSGDVAGLLGTDGFVELPADTDEFAVGYAARFWSWR